MPPDEDDPCDIDVRYACGYGDAVVCDETVFSSPHEKVCMCGVNGTFACESFECPVPCPDALPVEGSPCSPFVGDNGVCTYGEFCCPEEGGNCIPEKKYTCNNPDDGLRIIDAVTLECPSVCPKTPPADGDICDVDSRFKCVYGDAVICDGDPGYAFPYERECSCVSDTFTCDAVRTCNSRCPENPPSEGDVCQGFFGPVISESLGCRYGELCCPDEQGGRCVADQKCVCEPLSSRVICGHAASDASLPCRSLCPPTPPQTDDVCDIDSRYECRYGVPLPCDVDPSGFSVYQHQCSCLNGKFSCTSRDCPPVACPELQPALGDTCSPFLGGSCNYAKQPCCVPGGAVPCVANSTCSCDETDYTVKCSELPMVFCPTQVNGNNTSTGGNGKMNSKNKKGKKPKNNMNMRKLR